MNRRKAIAVLAVGTGATVVRPLRGYSGEPMLSPPRARIRQSVCRWPYQGIALDELCRQAKAIGLQSVELLNENEWPVATRSGLTCAMAMGPTTIPVGFNRPDQHDRIVAEAERLLPLIAQAKLPNMIVFSGNRAGLSDAEGLEHCARGLLRITPLAERLGVTVCMELLNSKVDHKDYQGDHSAFGVGIVKAVNSPRVKLLYDIYHMQIMEGDLIRTIKDNKDYFAHFHTGGVPGRHELDDTQEVHWRTVATAIADTGFQGYFAHEFIPVRDPLTSLREAVALCDV